MMSLHFAILSASNRFSSVASREDSVIVLVALFSSIASQHSLQ